MSNVPTTINDLKRDGFANGGGLVFDESERRELAQLLADAYRKMESGHPYFIAGEHGNGGLRGLPELHPRIAELLNRLITEPRVRAIIEEILGPTYKIWQIDLKRTAPGDRGLYLHQDARGQLNIAVMLSDNLNGDGATAFLPGSHLVPARIAELGAQIPARLVNWMAPLLARLSGRAGDIGFFLNRTWHGRFANTSNATHDVILIALFPAGARMSYPKPYVMWSREFLDANRATALARLLDPEIGTVRQADGYYEITAPAAAPPPYSMVIEEPARAVTGIGTSKLKLKASVLAMRLAMGIVQPGSRALRLVRARR